MREPRRQSIARYLTFIAIVCSVALVHFTEAAPQGSGSSYQLAQKVVLGGEGGWDYLFADSATQRLFISRGSHTTVVDADGKVLGDIAKTDGVHGTAVATEFNRGFTSNGRANTVSIFDLTTLQTIGEVKVSGQGPDSIIYDPASKRIFTFNGRTSDATAIDAKSGEVVGTIKLGGKPETAQADGAGQVYVNLEDKSQIAMLDSKALTVLNTWPVAPCESPSGLAIDAAHHRLFAGCENKIMAVIDSTNGKVVATVPIGQGVDANAFDPGTGFAFASCGDGNITVAHGDSADHYTVVDTIMTQRGARTMAVDTKTHTVYTVTAEFGPAPAVTPQNPRPRPSILPNSFTLLIYRRAQQGAITSPGAGASPKPIADATGSLAPANAPGTASSRVDRSDLVTKGKALYSAYQCFGCHGLNGEGTDNAPDLMGTLLSGNQISAFLQNPSADATAKGMPSFPATSPDLPPLVAYVLSIKRPPN
jgi:DNA-binding beta-propeller fold protein YncE/mono/diheme cytochrome c family protein